MNSGIRILDPRVAQQVAAGEVVDRPASVVKELVENALDAGAAVVEIDLQDGGRGRIRVRDDGSGMGADDAAKSVLAHATSKIAHVEDLESVGTLGFRGEALPSIASVSDFSLTTSTGEGAGTSVHVQGGGEAEVTAASHPRGTTVVVDRLFYNVPARRAFLKGAKTERAAIVDIISHLSLAHPMVAFKVTESGREVRALPGAKGLGQRLAQHYGVGQVRAFRPVAHRAGPFEVRGYAAPPSITYTSRAACQTVSVNGRWVRVENLSRAIDDAYRGTVAAGRYPPVVLDVKLDPRGVDVNVHPTKQLVRFSDERALRSVMGDALKLALEWVGQNTPAGSGAGGTGETESGRPAASRQESPASVGRSPVDGTPDESGKDESGKRTFGSQRPQQEERTRVPEKDRTLRPGDLPEARRRIREASAPAAPPLQSAAPEEGVAGGTSTSPGIAGGLTERGMLPVLEEVRVVGQIGNGYIMLDEPGAVWFVDQHVAHERAILDRLTDDASPPTVQPLLIPQVVELSGEEVALAAESLEELSVYGFEAEPFGPRSMRINSVISTLAARSEDVPGAFAQALAAIRGTEAGMVREQRILATIACHSAVKLGDRMAHTEMEALVKDWLTSRLPATCPHGRSICFRMDHRDIGRKLDRH